MPIETAILLAVCMSNPPASTAPFPPTKAVPVRDTLHGVEIVDEFRWLEPLEKDSSEVAEWTTTQNEHTRRVIEGVACRDELAKALEPWMTLGAVGAPQMTDGGYFYSQRTGTQNQGLVKFRATLDAEPCILLDVNSLDE